MNQKTLKEIFTELLSKHGRVLVLIDPYNEELILPTGLAPIKPDHPLVLDYNLNAVIPIPDLEIKDDGIYATLSFQRTPFKTFVPWNSVVVFVTKKPDDPANAKTSKSSKSKHLKLV